MRIKAGQLDSILLIGTVIILIFGHRIVLPLGGNLRLPLIAVYMPVATALWWGVDAVRLEPIRLLLYILTILAAIISSLIAVKYSPDFSLFSLVYFILLYIPVLHIHRQSSKQGLVFHTFQISMVIIAFIGLVQFLTQLAGIGYSDYLLSVSPTFIEEYNTSIPLFRGSPMYKANGLFLLEPSYYSQYLALAILIDTFYFRKFVRLFVYIPALLVSFSGTGIVVLIAGLLANIKRWPIKRLFAPGMVISILVLAFLTTNYGQITLSRLGEFTDPNGSAYNRFIAPFLSFKIFLSMGPDVVFFGGGAGSLDAFRELIQQQIPTMHPNLFIKLFYEYGMLFGSAIMIFILNLFWGRRGLAFLKIPLFVLFSIVTSGLLNPQQLYLSYIVGLFFVVPAKNKQVTATKLNVLSYEKQVSPL